VFWIQTRIRSDPLLIGIKDPFTKLLILEPRGPHLPIFDPNHGYTL